MKALEVARLSYGLGELLLPSTISGLILGHRPDPKATVFIRILGARHLAQGLLLSSTKADRWHRVGGVVDLIHAATMLILAAVDPDRRQAATLNAALAIIFGAGEL